MRRTGVFLLALSLSGTASAGEIIELPHEDPSGVAWEKEERQYFSEIWNTPVVTNVSVPTMQVFRPPQELANGTALVIAPGGGFYALSIESEGNQVADWLVQKGITAFVLKYRLVPTGEDGVKEVSEAGDRFVDSVAPILPLATCTVWVAIDDSGNRAGCIQVVDVVDEEPPNIECPEDVIV